MEPRHKIVTFLLPIVTIAFLLGATPVFSQSAPSTYTPTITLTAPAGISVSPSTLTFTTTVEIYSQPNGGVSISPASAQFIITNNTSSTFSWIMGGVPQQRIANIEPSQGSLAPGSSQTVTFTPLLLLWANAPLPLQILSDNSSLIPGVAGQAIALSSPEQETSLLQQQFSYQSLPYSVSRVIVVPVGSANLSAMKVGDEFGLFLYDQNGNPIQPTYTINGEQVAITYGIDFRSPTDSSCAIGQSGGSEPGPDGYIPAGSESYFNSAGTESSGSYESGFVVSQYKNAPVGSPLGGVPNCPGESIYITGIDLQGVVSQGSGSVTSYLSPVATFSTSSIILTESGTPPSTSSASTSVSTPAPTTQSSVTSNTASTPSTTSPITISANPSSITLGQSSTLTWSAPPSSVCTGSGAWSDLEFPTGTQSVTPISAGTSVYTLTCGSWSRSATVTVSGPETQSSGASSTSSTSSAGPTLTISADPTSVILGQSSTITWSAPLASVCTASGAWSGLEFSSGTQSVTPTSTGPSIYTLTCGSWSQSTTVTAVVPGQAIASSPVTPTTTGNSNGNSSMEALQQELVQLLTLLLQLLQKAAAQGLLTPSQLSSILGSISH